MELLKLLALTIFAFMAIAGMIYLIFSLLQNKKSNQEACQTTKEAKSKTFGCACGAGTCVSKE